jgi:class 3 adenylate cyclase
MTEPPRRRRKLAAILMLDVVGFSRMMGRDEEATTSAILAFHETVREVVERHGGRVVSTAGDSVFGDFDSIVEALESAEEIQRALHAENEGRPVAERIEARVGLHLGDVIVEERNVFGDGVNVAARLEQMAEPGGIMLSEAAYHLVRGRTALPIETIGVHSLKNIEEPIEVYRIGPDAFGRSRHAGLEDADESDVGSEANQRIREAVARIAERVADRVDDVDAAPDGSGLKREARAAVLEDDKVVTLFKAGNLTLIALGVAGIVAWTSGWTGNGWYPFLGCFLVGAGLGGGLERLSRRQGVGRLCRGVGLGVGAMFHGNGVTQTIFLVIAVAVFASGIQDLLSQKARRRDR